MVVELTCVPSQSERLATQTRTAPCLLDRGQDCVASLFDTRRLAR
jgi:hypothetical protein